MVSELRRVSGCHEQISSLLSSKATGLLRGRAHFQPAAPQSLHKCEEGGGDGSGEAGCLLEGPGLALGGAPRSLSKDGRPPAASSASEPLKSGPVQVAHVREDVSCSEKLGSVELGADFFSPKLLALRVRNLRAGA